MSSMLSRSLSGQTFLITGVANKKSIAYSVALTLLSADAKIILSVQTSAIAEKVRPLFSSSIPILICDLEQSDEIAQMATQIQQLNIRLAGFLHSVAFAQFDNPPKAFHEVPFDSFMRAIRISCFSFTEMANALKDLLIPNASAVTISISDTRATAYGYLGPIKGLLEQTVPFLAHSFAQFSQVRFNAVCPGPLKTSASSGIPNYLDNYLYAEQLTLRKKAITTQEAADTICFLLSPISSGINGQKIIVDAGISCNFFDANIVKTVIDHTQFS